MGSTRYTKVWCFHRIHNKNATLLQLTIQKCGIYRQIVTNIRQIVANIVQKVTIIVQKAINTVQNVTKIVQLHLLLPAFKPVILIYHISVVFYYSLPVFTYIYHISVVFYYSLPQKCGIYVIYIVQSQGYKCARKTGTNKLCAQSARFWH